MDFIGYLKNGMANIASHRKYMKLAQTAARKQSMLLDLQRQTDTLTQKDVGAWHSAWQMAINVEEPRRAMLYDIYTNALIDNHLSGCIDQRKGQTLQKNFIITGKDGKEDERAKRYFENEWFTQFLDLALDARYWGHSLIQFGDIIGRGTDTMRFENCMLVPRKHVVQEYGIITREVGGDLTCGVSYREGEMADWCVEVGGMYDLGLLLKVAPQCLSKKNMLAYWDVFGEIFGMPMRIATTPSQDKEDWNKIASMLQSMAAAGWGVFPDGAEIEIKETSRGDAYNVYDKRIERANSEISKAIVGQTMTIDNGSSQSQSETHLEVFKNLCKADATAIKYTINNRLLPLMVTHGFPLQGCSFDWDDAASYTPAERREMERLLLQEFDIDPDYFIERYKIPIIGKKTQPEIHERQETENRQRGSQSNVGAKGETKLVRIDDFFV